MLHGRTHSMLACHITIHVLLQGMVNQRPGALLDILVGIPGDIDAMQASLLNYYLKCIEEVRLCNAFCCMPAAILVSASATIDIIGPKCCSFSSASTAIAHAGRVWQVSA